MNRFVGKGRIVSNGVVGGVDKNVLGFVAVTSASSKSWNCQRSECVRCKIQDSP
jgi:hypothetical protein